MIGAIALVAGLAAPPEPPTSPWLEWFVSTGGALGGGALGFIAGANIGEASAGDAETGLIIGIPLGAIGGAVLGAAVLRESEGRDWSVGGAFLGAGLAGGLGLGAGLALRDEHPTAAAITSLGTSLLLTPIGALLGAAL